MRAVFITLFGGLLPQHNLRITPNLFGTAATREQCRAFNNSIDDSACISPDWILLQDHRQRRRLFDYANHGHRPGGTTWWRNTRRARGSLRFKRQCERCDVADWICLRYARRYYPDTGNSNVHTATCAECKYIHVFRSRKANCFPTDSPRAGNGPVSYQNSFDSLSFRDFGIQQGAKRFAIRVTRSAAAVSHLELNNLRMSEGSSATSLGNTGVRLDNNIIIT